LDGRHDLSRIAGIIRDMSPDFIGLQEITSRGAGDESLSQLEMLAKETGMTAIGGPTMNRIHGDYGNGLLTSCPVLDIRQIDLSYRKREPRGALDVDLQVNGKVVRIVVTHLGLKPVERRFQARRLIESLGVLTADLVVLMGDLNEWFIYGRPLRWLHRHFGKVRTPATFPAPRPFLALDRILVSPQHQLLSLTRVNNAATRVASDHLPLKALVQLG
jgi:endonuclease/exonuclease/phosphatase family metal-dependent hydrolase